MITSIVTQEVFPLLERSIMQFHPNSQILLDDRRCVYAYPTVKDIVNMKFQKKKKNYILTHQEYLFFFHSNFKNKSNCYILRGGLLP